MTAESDLPPSLDECIFPLESTAPAQESGDLQPLRSIFCPHQVIGLGAATHGTREFFQLKHRIIRFLVEECSLRIVGLEANFSESLALNDFVVHGNGNPRTALSGIYFWTWNTEEMLALLKWLRAFNADRPLSDRVRFYGFDAQFTAGPVAALHSFLERADPDYHSTVESTLNALDDTGQSSARDDSQSRLQAADQVVEDLRARLHEYDSEYVAATDRTSWELACRHLRILARACDLKAAMHEGDRRRAMAVRDEAMADNITWIREHETADTVAVWAHNDHVNRVETRAKGDAAPSMGSRLADRYGDDYYALGFEFGGGAFQALAPSDAEDGGDAGCELGERTLETALPDTLGQAFTAHDLPPFVLDFTGARDDPQIGDWLDGAHRLHSIGATYREDDRQYHVESYPLSEAFDGLCYVDETTRARPL